MAGTAPAAVADTPQQTVIAVVGTNGQLYSKRSNEGFRNLGGVVVDSPAVAYSPVTGRTYYVVKSSNNALYIRTDVSGYTKIGGVCRYGPGAAIVGNYLVVACAGTNRALYYTYARLSSPTQFAGFVYQGGTLSQGPSVSAIGSAAVFAVVGPIEFDNHASVYTRRHTDPVGAYRDEFLSCAGQPDQVSVRPEFATEDSFAFFGCRATDYSRQGSFGQHYYLWNDFKDQADGRIVGRVGIAASADNSGALYYVTSSDGRIYSKPVFAEFDMQATGYTVVGCCVRPGVAAATITG